MDPNVYKCDYTCTKCDTVITMTNTSAIICSNCYNRIFRKDSTNSVIRISGI